MPRLSARPLLAILAAGLVGFALGYASEAAAAEKAVSGGSASFSQGTAHRSVGRAGRQAGLASARRLAFSGGTARSDRRGYRALERARNLYETEGSLTRVRRSLRDEALLDGLDEADEPFGGGYDLPYPDAYAAAPGSFPSEAKIIDIGRPAPAPVDTILTGSTKIIRIAPDDRRQHERARSAAVEAGDRQPWSSGWLTHCMAAYASFDPALGTYVAGDGRVRFCEAE